MSYFNTQNSYLYISSIPVIYSHSLYVVTEFDIICIRESFVLNLSESNSPWKSFKVTAVIEQSKAVVIIR